MNLHRPCTFATFWLGYKSWLAECFSKTWPEVSVEIDREYPKATPLRHAIMLVAVVVLMLMVVAALPFVARHSVQAGVSSQAFMSLSGMLVFALTVGLLGRWAVRQARRLRWFCEAMCERGYALQESRVEKV